MEQSVALMLATIALKGVTREYPNAPGHVLAGASDIKSPRELHPAFYGCFDWHSAVHTHWMLVRLLRTYPGLPVENEIRAVLDDHLTQAHVEAEAAYFGGANRQSFERPYGWAWLLKLAEELAIWAGEDAGASRWSANLQPLVEVIVRRYLDYFPKQVFPIRVGTHANTAFGLSLAFDFAQTCGDRALSQLVVERAHTYFAGDADYPAQWEPSGNDFLSPSLVEADLMRRILTPTAFAEWFHRFLPGISDRKYPHLLTPVSVTDRSDPGLVHLDGLNLSRAWCLKEIAGALPAGDRAREALAAAAGAHLEAGLAHVASGEYMGEHWLASFAVYALTSGSGR